MGTARHVGPEAEDMARAIRGLRAEHRLSQAELARQVGVSTRTWIKVEKGEHPLTLGLLIGVGDAFELTLAELAQRAGL